MHQFVDHRAFGSATVGVRDEGSISEYLAEKAAREGERGWLHRAFAEIFRESRA